MLKNFLEVLKLRNETLFYFGLICFVLALIFIGLTTITNTKVLGVNAWYKPFKFSLSIALYSWTMAWICFYLPPTFPINAFNWSVIGLLGFEIVYIGIQAYRGELSHFNLSTPFYSFLYALMALAASAVTLWTAYIGYCFFQQGLTDLPDYYLWGIRLGIIIFVIFSFEGFVMGSRLTHTIGGPDGGDGIPFVNWSTKYGDPRIAHFIGMHALQVIPLLSYYLLKNTKLTFVIALLYALLAIFTLWQALQGIPFHHINIWKK